MENIEQMRKRHDKEIDKLRSNCKHKESTRMPYMWAPGHFSNDVEVCDFCGEMLKTYDTLNLDNLASCDNIKFSTELMEEGYQVMAEENLHLVDKKETELIDKGSFAQYVEEE